MALILNIDTATEHASVCLSNNNEIIGIEESIEQKNHASFVQPAIQKILNATHYSVTNIDAIAVTNGPGSYTGLRVGLSSAKGLSYALNKPLLLINTLQVMANAAYEVYKKNNLQVDNVLFCPMIDARRMEVFTALYNASVQEIQAPSATIIDTDFLQFHLKTNTVICSGNGSKKLHSVVQNPNLIMLNVQHNAANMVLFATENYTQQRFANLAYSEPFYLKEFYTPIKK